MPDTMGHKGMIVLLVVGTFLCVSAKAVRPEHWQDATTAGSSALWLHLPTPSGRTLQQGDALSNSNGCLPTIPKCEAGACAVRNIMGIAKWVCLRCVGNYEPVVDPSGQDNIVQCVCPKGTYEASAAATSCARCPADAYCSGGDKVESPTSRGELSQCGAGLITRNTGARSVVDCVAPAGYAMTAPNTATPCERSQYAPKFNRLNRCLRCQGGLEESPAANLTAAQRTSKRAVCKVPPGKYVSQGLVRMCSQGFYRENYTDFDATVAQKCLPCNPGITTDGAGAEGPWKCNRVLAGYGIDSITNVTGPEQLPALPQDDSGLPGATVCQLGFYSAGGYCAQCPANTVTRVLGAKSIEECSVAPGYYIPAGGSMTPCGSGFFREGWLMYSDTQAASCTPCGENILSDARDVDENPLAAIGSLVRTTSATCYIEPGQGMVVSGRNVFKATDCPVNTYGVAGRVYGWAAAPCKPCPRNMITDNVTRAVSSDACVNPHGFGYASEGASRCAPGFYAAKGSHKACTRCPDGRTTFDNPDQQRYVTDCNVAPGNGVVGAATANGDFLAADLTGLSEMQILSLSVITCPTGYYSVGDTIAATCSKCPEGSTTKEPSATSIWECDVCLPGRGKANSTAPCTPCEYGTFQPGGLAECQPCPLTTFYPPVDGLGPTYTANGTTFSKGATGVEWCVPVQSQLSPEAGQAYFAPELGNLNLTNFFDYPGVPSLEACIGKCAADLCCMAQFDTAAGGCKAVWLPPAAEDEEGPVIWVKLPAAGLSAASSVKTNSPQNVVITAQGVAAGSSSSSKPQQSSRTPRVQAGSQRTVPLGKKAVAESAAAATAAVAAPQSAGGAQQEPKVGAKTLASGLYARCALPEAHADAWVHIGSTLGLDARTFVHEPALWHTSTLEACQELCDNSNVCWGGIYKNGQCMFRGGIDALHTRSFFSLPAPNSAPGLVIPDTSSYYFTFSSLNGAPLANVADGSTQTLLSTAVEVTLKELTQVPDDIIASVWEQSAVSPDSSSVEIGFTLLDSNYNPVAVNIDVMAMFVSNASTTAYVAHTIIELAVNASDTTHDAVLAAGLTIVSSDGAQKALGTPLIIDGCELLQGYCNTDHAVPGGTCSLNVCQCQEGWMGNRCTAAAGGR